MDMMRSRSTFADSAVSVLLNQLFWLILIGARLHVPALRDVVSGVRRQ